MKGKLLVLATALVMLAGTTLFAVSYVQKCDELSGACQKSCTMDASAGAVHGCSMEAHTCPMTKDCPPSKCAEMKGACCAKGAKTASAK